MKGKTIGLMVALVLGAWSAPADAYCVLKGSGKVLSWKTQPVPYRVSSNLKDAKILAAIDKAFQTWASVKCAKLTVKRGASFPVCTDPACKAFSSPKGAIFVYWITSASDLFKNTSSPKMPYVTSSYFQYDTSGGLSGYAIAINAKDYKWNTTGGSSTGSGILDVQNEVTQLAGGGLGLNDSNVAGSTMYNKIAFGDTSKRTLAKDDINGITYLYRDPSCAAPPAPGASGCTSGGTKTDGGGTVKKDAGTTQKDSGGTTQQDQGGSTWQDQGGSSQADSSTKQCTKSTECPSGYVCTAEGQCVSTTKQCTKSTQCGVDEICSAEGRCVKVGGNGDDGCGCSFGSAGQGRSAAGGLVLLGLALLIVFRRRR